MIKNTEATCLICAAALLVAACSADGSEREVRGAGGTTGQASGGTAGGGGSGVGGSATGGAASAVTCAAATGANPLVADFEDFDIGATLHEASFDNGDQVKGGFYEYHDGTELPVWEVTGEGRSGAHALAFRHTSTEWGAGTGVWWGCVDASVYSGLAAWVKGPVGMKGYMTVGSPESKSVEDPYNPGECPHSVQECNNYNFGKPFAYTGDWQEITVLWGEVGGGDPWVPLPSKRIQGLDFYLSLGESASGDFELLIDEVSFIHDGSGTGGANGTGGASGGAGGGANGGSAGSAAE